MRGDVYRRDVVRSFEAGRNADGQPFVITI